MMAVERDLVIRLSTQPTTHDLGLVRLPATYAFQLAARGQVDALLFQRLAVSLDRADRHLKHLGQVFLCCSCLLSQGFFQQALNAYPPQRHRTMRLQHLPVFLSGVDRPRHFGSCCPAQCLTVACVQLCQDDAHLSWTEPLSLTKKVRLGFVQKDLGHWRWLSKVLFEHG